MDAFGRNLRHYRMMVGMTQEDLARATGVTRGSLSNYEINRTEPEFEFICRAAQVLGVSIDQLFADKVDNDYIARMLVTDDEAGLLQAYREADPIYQNVALDILRSHRRQE